MNVRLLKALAGQIRDLEARALELKEEAADSRDHAQMRKVAQLLATASAIVNDVQARRNT